LINSSMHPRTKIIMALTVAVLAASSTFAGDKKEVFVIKGKVIDDDGKPADEAQVRVKALDRKAPVKIVQTDSKGQYIVLGLVAGNYTITAYDFAGSARSRATIKTDRKGWAKVNFDFGLDSMVGDGGNTVDGQDHFASPCDHMQQFTFKR
jgi:hypothetical protein